MFDAKTITEIDGWLREGKSPEVIAGLVKPPVSRLTLTNWLLQSGYKIGTVEKVTVRQLVPIERVPAELGSAVG